MSTSSFTMQTFNHDNSYIVMERGKFLSTMPIYFDNYFFMSTSSFTMQTFNHDNSYIVLDSFLIHFQLSLRRSVYQLRADSLFF